MLLLAFSLITSHWASPARAVDSLVRIPSELTYLLPPSFDSELTHSFVNSTTTLDPGVNDLLASARHVPFISFDDEFDALLGSNAAITLVDQRVTHFAGEAGVWIPERNEVWYTTWINDGPTHVEILSLADYTIRNLTSSRPVHNPNGGFFHQRLMYFTCLRDDSRGWPGGIVSVDPATGHVEDILNSYFGLKFDSIDDLAWVSDPATNDSYLFFTNLPFATALNASSSRAPQGLWRFDPQKKSLQPAISRTEFPVANGVRFSKDQKTMYITDFGGDERARVFGLPARVGIPGVYTYELDDNTMPVNRKVFSVARLQAPDGIRVDDRGRVWTGEGEGVVVRNAGGKAIGVFNAQYFTSDPVNFAIVQFALAGDKLVILGMDKLWVVELAERVVAA
jgi:gluconolactonase